MLIRTRVSSSSQPELDSALASGWAPLHARHSADGGPASPRRAPRYISKRILDLVFLSIGMLPACVLLAIGALTILLDDGRPILFRQVRVGRHGQPFTLLKLRTMRHREPTGSTFPDAERFTRAGRMLRRTSIDELPQLINIARGEMSLVGPRPTLPYQVERYDSRQRGRLAVLPGLTGLAQVHGRNRMSWPERIEWDLHYVESRSLQLDLAILAQTVLAVLTGDGVAGHSRLDPIARQEGQQEERRCTVHEATPRIRLARPDIGEEEVQAVRKVLMSGVLTGGLQNAAFEEEFANRHRAAYGVTFASGTAALSAMLLAEDIGPGDEVIVPSMTFVSTATSVCHVGAVPVFADVEPRTFNLDPDAVTRRITPRTRAIMTVHYAGQPGDLDALLKVCADNGLVLFEDAAQAAGAAYRGVPAGTFGKSAMFSFTPTKNITMGEGGIVLTADAETADRLRMLRNHGQRRLYEHTLLGYNWRLSEMQAAIGRVQLSKLDAILSRKRANAAWMNSRLEKVPGIKAPYQAPYASSPYMLYTCLIEAGRDQVLEFLLARGIEARIYFPPVHRQPIFAGQYGRLSVTENLAARMLSLPMHSRLSPADLAEIADTLEEALGRASGSR